MKTKIPIANHSLSDPVRNKILKYDCHDQPIDIKMPNPHIKIGNYSPPDQASENCLQKPVGPMDKPTKSRATLNKSVILDIYYRPIGIIGALINHSTPPQPCKEVAKQLTARELDVLNLLIRGFSVKSIALKLEISIHTVTGHLKSIYAKLGVHSKNEALFKAMHSNGGDLIQQECELRSKYEILRFKSKQKDD